MATIFLIDDVFDSLKTRSEIIKSLGYECLTASTVNEASNLLEQDMPDVLMIELKTLYSSGIHILKAIKDSYPKTAVIIFSGDEKTDEAIQAITIETYNYIQRPITAELLETVLAKAIESQKIDEQNYEIKAEIKKHHKMKEVICKSNVMIDVVDRVRKVATSDANILIYGETGTGKEMIARNVHLCSHRKNKSFIAIDCIALPPTLLESELFGFEKGAFTDAIKAKPGILELADGGTLFLDEIIELAPPLQAKLLRVLQERQFRRIGGTKLINVDVRIIAATNQNPENAIEKKRLRDDLYYRLNVISILMPPLRERKEDIELLAHHFINEFNPSFPIEVKGISDHAMKRLKTYNWPGNVRELKNVIEHAMSLTDQDIISVKDLPEKIRMHTSFCPEVTRGETNFKQVKEAYLQEFYKKYFDNLLNTFNGNLSKVAEKASISRKTLYQLLRKIKTKS